MRFRYFIWLALLICAPAAAKGPAALRVMAYNIRLDTPVDGLNDWSHRRDMLTSQIYWLRPDIFGLQEVVINQKRDIARALPEFTLIGNGRDDGQDRGESSPVGDFNCEPGSEPLRILTDPIGPLQLREARLNSATPPFGPAGTFNDFKLQAEAERTIDQILVGGQQGREIAVSRFAVIAQNVAGRMISDHYPVLADLILN
jgi:endonuclease/exonuclease/phosphatase family metal-dependent hydrolase